MRPLSGGEREDAENLKVKMTAVLSQVIDLEIGDDGKSAVSWDVQKIVGIVTDSPHVNKRTRRLLLEANLFPFAYGCAAHANCNLAKDFLKCLA